MSSPMADSTTLLLFCVVVYSTNRTSLALHMSRRVLHPQDGSTHIIPPSLAGWSLLFTKTTPRLPSLPKPRQRLASSLSVSGLLVSPCPIAPCCRSERLIDRGLVAASSAMPKPRLQNHQPGRETRGASSRPRGSRAIQVFEAPISDTSIPPASPIPAHS